MNLKSRIYEGAITHARTKPVKHNFSFPIYTFVIDLDELDLLDKEVRFFGYNRGSVFALYDSDHLGSGEGSIKQKLKKWLNKFGHKEKYSTVKMITTLRVFKHTFNPVIFYYCLDSENNISTVYETVLGHIDMNLRKIIEMDDSFFNSITSLKHSHDNFGSIPFDLRLEVKESV